MSRVDAAYPIAIALAEGGWVAVLYLLVDAVARVDAPVGLPVFALVAGACCGLADRLDRLPASRLAVIVGLLVGGGLIGLGLSAGRLIADGGTDPSRVLTSDPGAALIGLAALRGFIRTDAIRDPAQAVRPLLVGMIGLSLAWLFGGALREPMRSAFRAAAVVPTLGFVVGGSIAAGLAQSALAASEVGFDPRVNRSWLVVLVGASATLGLAALPIGIGVERLFGALIAWPLTLPLLLVVGVVARIVVPSRTDDLRRTWAFTVGPLLVLFGLALLAPLLPQRATGLQPELPAIPGVPTSEPNTPVFDAIVALAAIALVVGVLLFLARASRRHAVALVPPNGAERHDVVVSWTETDEEGRRGLRARLRRLVRRRRPTDAVTAYLAALRTLKPNEALRRHLAETPAAHAQRLREAGAGTLELDLLAADFELVRWGGRRVSPAEDRRAIARWERFRDRAAMWPADD
jgi:hypothetical protein